VTVAGWPTLILLMSLSLKATVIVIRPVLTISANPELELVDEALEPELDAELDPVPDPPSPPAVAEPPPAVEPEPLELEDVPLEAAVEVDPADTESPGERLASETIVPLVGASSRVCARAVWALRTPASAL
jgi:hypothetical protein